MTQATSTPDQSLQIDQFLDARECEHFSDQIGELYQALVEALQQMAEADAHPEAYWPMAKAMLLRRASDAIDSAQEGMRSERNSPQ